MGRRPHYGVVVLALVVLTVFGSLGLARFGYAMVLPAMQKALALSNAQTGALQSCNLLGYLVTVVGAGVLGPGGQVSYLSRSARRRGFVGGMGSHLRGGLCGLALTSS